MIYFFQFQDFIGNAQELADAALDCASHHNWLIDKDKTNERLVRYYVTVQVLDKPNRVGRDASYQYRHLLQLLIGRRMLDKGFNLAAIAEHNQKASTSELVEKLLSRDLEITDAQALIKKFKSSGSSSDKNTFTKNRNANTGLGSKSLDWLKRKSLNAAMGSGTGSGSGEANPFAFSSSTANGMRPPMAIQDVLEEVKRLKDECMHQISFIFEIPNEMEKLTQSHHTLERLIRNKTNAIEIGLKNLETEMNQKEDLLLRNIETLIKNHLDLSNTQHENLIKQVTQLEQKIEILIQEKHMIISESKNTDH
jgi:DNA-binding transcriptional MerR regulator